MQKNNWNDDCWVAGGERATERCAQSAAQIRQINFMIRNKEDVCVSQMQCGVFH